ncbi:MAG TPA: hypothetical protein VGY99_29465 [Candidatus Binataceae bacterium]|jgi:hypothetical protein|nr:hypothetical protein [Candidatus Binataceae bacterium]
MKRHNVIVDGALAGLLGAVTVALWFLIFDISRGRPLETPALLAAALLHGQTIVTGVHLQLVIEYTVLHFAAFVLFGVAAAVLIEAAERESSLIISLLIFLFAFEVLFMGLTIFLGPMVSAALSWWSVLAGNLLATAVMLGYFFLLRHPVLLRHLLGPWVNILFEGIAAGLIGGTAVAIWFLLCDMGTDTPFRTPALLGGVLLQGIYDPAAIHVSAPLVLGYTVLHYAAFILFGIAASCLVAASEREPILLLGFLILFACFEVFFLGFAAMLSHSLLDQIGWSTIVAGNMLAAVAMIGFFFLRHRKLHIRLRESWAAITQE